MQIAFCEGPVLSLWLTREVARAAGRRVAPDRSKAVERVGLHLDYLKHAGSKPACTVDAATDLVTAFYKHEPPFVGETKGFSVLKSFARQAAHLLRREVELISPAPAHFAQAEALWLSYYVKGARDTNAGFHDYLHAAWVIRPSDSHEVRHVVVGHQHLPYILRKTGWMGVAHHLPI